MDGSNWKKLLVDWINNSVLLDRCFYNIEQTDIYDFYTKLRQKMVAFPSKQEDILLFLKEQYPNVEIHSDDENQLSSSDYMYVYSLLLHFCCVKYPDEYFQKICQNLHNIYQQSIATYFKELETVQILDKTVLRNVISASTPNTIPSRIESPARSSKSKISPPTPKTHMLDERTKEMQRLKALLDNEIYEKSCMEMLLKQNEEKTLELIKGQKKFVTEIQELKNELLAKSTENSSPNKNFTDEQIKKQLRKHIAEKEDQFLNLKENYNTVIEDKKTLQQKLKHAEKQMSTCMDNLIDNESKLLELKSVIEEKDIYIKEITESQNELIRYINDNQSNRGTDFNTSVECLDNSLSRTPNSSGSLGSPESLGCSVIDIQLREKILENSQLRKENEKFKIDNKKLSEHLCSLFTKHTDNIEIFDENFIPKKDDDLTEIFIIFENYLEKLIQQYSTVNNELCESLEENKNLNNQILQLGNKIIVLSSEVNEYDKKVDDLKKEKLLIVEENQTFQTNCESYNKKIKTLIDENTELKTNLNNLNEDHKKLINQKDQLNEEFSLKISNLSENLTEKCGRINEFENLNMKLENDNILLQENVTELSKNNKNLENLTNSLKQEKELINKKYSKLQNKLKQSEESIEKLRNELKSSLTNLENTVLSKDTDIQKLADTLNQSNIENAKLSSDITILKDANADIIKEKQDIVAKYKVISFKVQNDFELKIQEIIELRREIEENTVKTEQLYSQINVLISKDLVSENTLQAIRIDVDFLNNEIGEKNKLIAQLQDEFNSENEKYEQLKTLNNNVLLDFNNKLEKYIQSEKSLKQKNDELTEQCGELKDNLKLYTLRSKEKEQEIDSLETKLKNKIIECTDFNKDIEKLTSNNSSSKFDIEYLNSKLCDSEQKISELKRELEKITAEKEKLNDEVSCLKNKNVEYEDQLKWCELETKKLYEVIDELKTDKNKISIEYDEISNIVETFTNEKIAVESELVILQKELNEKCESLLNISKLFDDELNKIIEEIENNADNLIQTKEFTNILQVNLVLNTPLERLKHTINILLSGNSEMLQKNNEFEKVIINLKNDLNVQNKENTELIEKLLITSNDNETLNSKLVKLTEQINEMMNNIQMVTDNCNVFKQEQFNLLDKLSVQQNELENIKLEKNSIIHQNSTLSNQYEKLTEDLELNKNNYYKKCADFDNILQEKNTKISINEDEKLKLTTTIKELNDKLKISNDRLKQSEEDNVNMVNECANMKYQNNLTLEKFVSKEKECILLSDEMRALATHSFSLEEHLANAKKTLEEYEKLKDKYENLNETRMSLKSVNEQLLKELNTIKNLLEEERYNFKKEICKLTNQSHNMEQQCQDCIIEIELLKENIIKITDNLNKTEDMKTVLMDENKKLKNQLELEMIKTDDNEKTIKELNNNISCWELKIKKSNDEIETIKNERDIEYLKLEKKYANLNTEFNKLNECHLKAEENSLQLNKRLEIISIRLGEYQGKSSNFESENNSLKKYFESNKSTLDSLQKEHSKLILKHSNLHKDYCRIQKSEESIKLILNETEQSNQQLKTELDKALAAELNGRDNLLKLQTMKKDDDEKIKKLSSTLAELTHINQSVKQEIDYLEQKNVQLTLEIGSLNQLNQSIEDLKKVAQTEKMDITKNLIQIKNENASLRDVNEKQQFELNQIREENSKLNDNISKLTLKLQIIKEEQEASETEINNHKSALKQLQNEKENSLRESFVSLALLKNLETQQTTKDDKIEKLKEMLNEKDKHLQQLNDEILLLKSKTDNHDELNKKLIEFEELNNLYELEKEKTEKLKRDTSIFQAKLTKHRSVADEKEKEWLDERKRLIEINKTSEERIKNNRLELEGKLEKMKSKMKTLYNEEVTKLKNKHDREIFDFQAEIQVLKGQNDKYDIHIKKLSHRVLTLNEKICEYERDNQFMELRLKEYENFKTTSLRRPPQQRQQLPINSQKILNAANLKMEDEEGEIFNNTYLTDLKEGRMSDFGIRDSISVKELQYRNSIAAPHLRSTYLAQYKEHNLQEEDIKDGIGPINLDDSLSSLLNTDKRKKVAGTTSYKRPGPPTPSKIAGRLSFGSNNEAHSAILKESNVNDVSTVRKTPAKFKLFSSRAKDENTPPRRRLSNMFKKK